MTEAKPLNSLATATTPSTGDNIVLSSGKQINPSSFILSFFGNKTFLTTRTQTGWLRICSIVKGLYESGIFSISHNYVNGSSSPWMIAYGFGFTSNTCDVKALLNGDRVSFPKARFVVEQSTIHLEIYVAHGNDSITIQSFVNNNAQFYLDWVPGSIPAGADSKEFDLTNSGG